LEDSGIDVVFGIPGTHNLEIYRYLAGSRLRHVTPRHEQGGGYAADGYARATGRPAALLTTSGPGLTNACTAAATAYADSVPMLIVSPGVPRGLERADVGWLHEVKDQQGHLDCLVERSIRVESAAEAYEAIVGTVQRWSSRRRRPVHVEIPVDVLEASMDGSTLAVPSAPVDTPSADDLALDTAARSLSAASTVAVIAGGGCRFAADELLRFVEATNALVLTTVNGKGAIPESHPRSLGASIRLPEAQHIADGADVLVVVGSELGDSDLWGGSLSPGGTVLRIDVDPAQLQKNLRADVTLCGDAPAVLRTLADRIGRRVGAADDSSAALRAELSSAALRDGAQWEPFHAALAAALPDDVVVAGDSAQVSYFGTVHQWPMNHIGQFLYPTGYATLGYGLPAAIGAKLGRPEAAVLAIVGDGGTMFTIQELLTAVDLELPIPVVVMNNGGYEEIRGEMRARDIPLTGVDVRSPDFPALAVACGARGIRVSTPADVAAEVGSALDARGPTLIEVALTAP
jgi:acetolactate synthase-1/2/3 large subunit